MDDKELDAIVKCHEVLKDLEKGSKIRIFKYLSDRYKIENVIPEEESSDKNQDSKKKNSKKSKTKRSKKSTTRTRTYSLITDLDLVSNGNESLKDFYSKYKASSNFDNNIITLYYLKRVLGLENIDVDHIYTCYKHLSLKIPKLAQSLRDTKNRKGWIDTSNSDNLKVTVAGENYIELEIEESE